jgi:hypothetical protein
VCIVACMLSARFMPCITTIVVKYICIGRHHFKKTTISPWIRRSFKRGEPESRDASEDHSEECHAKKMCYDKIQDEKERLLRYRPGAWLIEACSAK